MSSKVKNPEALNNLLKQILLSVFDQAQGEFQERTGKAVKLSSLQNMKYKAAQRLVAMGMNRLDKVKPEQQFERFSKLTNEHLPTVVSMVGEDVIVSRLQKLPKDVLNAEIVRSLDEAGAHEIAELLGKAVPEWQKPEVAVPVVEAPKPVVSAPVVTAPVVVVPVAPNSLEALKQQLSLMKEFRTQVEESIGQLETAIARAEVTAPVAAKKPQPF